MRNEHLDYLASNYLKDFKGSVLDIGCDQKYLQEILKPERYVGVDIGGLADLKLDLDKIEKLPFTDKEFDLVFSSNLIEHLENIHLIIDEMIRVGRVSVITTKTSANWGTFWSLFWKIETKGNRNEFGKYFKYYGLPLEKPSDRHRWFFSYDDIVELVKHRAEKQGKKVEVFERYLNRKRVFFSAIFGKNLFVSEVIFKIS